MGLVYIYLKTIYCSLYFRRTDLDDYSSLAVNDE